MIFVGKLRIHLKNWIDLLSTFMRSRSRSTEPSQLANLRHVRKHNCSNYAWKILCAMQATHYGTEANVCSLGRCFASHSTKIQMNGAMHIFFKYWHLNDETLILLLQRWHKARAKIVRHQCGQIINSNEFPIKSIHNCTHISGPPV